MSKPVVNISMNFGMIATIVLLILKVTDRLVISWGWVFAPIWLPPAVYLAVLALIALGGLFFIASTIIACYIMEKLK